ncbi:type II toxin-antitoxin system VapC family toxin [soil metagenome]
MRIYADSSALIKRAVEEAGSDALDAYLDEHFAGCDVIVASSLASVEVSRALRALRHAVGGAIDEAIDEAIETALSGVGVRPITDDVISVARRIAPPVLRTLDAIHLATAILLDVDRVLTYYDRLADACRHHHLAPISPT